MNFPTQILLVGVSIAGIAFLGSWILSFLGWREFAVRFKVEVPLENGQCFRRISGYFNILAAYRRCLTVIVLQEGLYIEPIAFLRLTHQPMLLPWTNVNEIYLKNSYRGLPLKVKFAYQNTQFVLEMPESAATSVFKASGRTATKT